MNGIMFYIWSVCRFFPQIPNDFSPTPTHVHNYAWTFNWCSILLNTGTNPDFRRFYLLLFQVHQPNEQQAAHSGAVSDLPHHQNPTGK